MSRVIRISEGTYEKTDVLCRITECSSRCRKLSGSRREPLTGLMDDVIKSISRFIRVTEGTPERTNIYDVEELSVPVDVESYHGLGGNLLEN